MKKPLLTRVFLAVAVLLTGPVLCGTDEATEEYTVHENLNLKEGSSADPKWGQGPWPQSGKSSLKTIVFYE